MKEELNRTRVLRAGRIPAVSLNASSLRRLYGFAAVRGSEGAPDAARAWTGEVHSGTRLHGAVAFDRIGDEANGPVE